MKERLNREQMAGVTAKLLGNGWVVNLGIGIPVLASNFIDERSGITLTSENGVIGYGLRAEHGNHDPDVVNAGVEYVTLTPGSAIVHHADSFAFIRSGRVDCSILGAYEVAADGSFANWKTAPGPYDGMGGIGGAMDLAACARRVFITMSHTTRHGAPRLVEHCNLPVTAGPGTVSLVVTDLGVVRVTDRGFELARTAPGWTAEEIAALTGAPLHVAGDVRPIIV